MSTEGELLIVNIRLMKFLNLWPSGRKEETTLIRFLRFLSGTIILYLGMMTVIGDFVTQVGGRYEDVMDIAENLTAFGALCGAIYMAICFTLNQKGIIKLIEDLQVFEEFGATETLLSTEKKSAIVTKVIMFYGIIGNLIYVAVPYINLDACREKRAKSKYSKDIPCELITRFRIPFDYNDTWWMIQLANVFELMNCLIATTITLAVTMFVVTVLMQVIAQLQELRNFIRRDEPVRQCIRYHIAIIDYATNMSQTFSTIMLMYITLTSFEISVLGFEILMVSEITNSIRFTMHLLGWLVLLYLVCSYGQQLIDESVGIGWEVYSAPWYNKTTSEQKNMRMMILRSQKPLILTAASLGTLSLEAFLNVLSTAYSYFTLLLNMKEE